MTIDERRRRLRGARGYAGFSHVDLAEKLGVSRDTVQRFEAGKAVDAIEEEVFLRRTAAACDLPYEFFTVDFKRLPLLHDENLTVVHDETTGTTQVYDAAIGPLIEQALEDASPELVELVGRRLRTLIEQAVSEEKPAEGDPPGERRLRFPPDRPRGAQNPGEDHRHAS